jgi:ABC-type dipeptide/oligopeptide/nickel transport system permease component
MKIILLRTGKAIAGWLTVLCLIFLLTVSLQHLRKGSAEEVLMGQRGTSGSLAALKDRSFTTRLTELAGALPDLVRWKTLRGTLVLPQIAHALAATAILSALSLLFSVVFGLAMLLVAEFYPRYAHLLAGIATAINTTPIFLVGIFFIWCFAFALRLLPSGGDGGMRFFVLPAITIAAKFGARLFLLLTNYMNELDNRVFILRARAYGLSNRRVFLHKLANCAMPFVIFWLIETASLFSGAVIVESLFSIHGLGQLLLFALLQYDIRLIFANLVVIATIVYLTSLLQKIVAETQERRA